VIEAAAPFVVPRALLQRRVPYAGTAPITFFSEDGGRRYDADRSLNVLLHTISGWANRTDAQVNS